MRTRWEEGQNRIDACYIPKQVYTDFIMKLTEFHTTLRAHPEARLDFVFDDGDTIPAAFHITEVGHVAKRFIDCGGTVRTVENVTLQAWVSPNDPDHRLAAGKLAGILDQAQGVAAGRRPARRGRIRGLRRVAVRGDRRRGAPGRASLRPWPTSTPTAWPRKPAASSRLAAGAAPAASAVQPPPP